MGENEGKDSQIFNALVKKPVNLIITSSAIIPHAHEHALAMCMTTMNASPVALLRAIQDKTKQNVKIPPFINSKSRVPKDVVLVLFSSHPTAKGDPDPHQAPTCSSTTTTTHPALFDNTCEILRPTSVLDM